MPLGLKLKVWLSEYDLCMTKAQRLNTHDLPTTSQRSEWLRRGAFFRLWECFLEFSHTFSLICLHLRQRNQHSHWWLSCLFFIVHYKPSICEEAHCAVKWDQSISNCPKPFKVCLSYKRLHIQETSQCLPQHELQHFLHYLGQKYGF